MHDDHQPIPFGAPKRPRPQIDLTEIEQAVLKEAGYVAAPPEPDKPTDIQYVANCLDCLRHLDLKEAVVGMLGPELPKDMNEAIDRVAEWAAANKTKAAA